MAGRLGHAGLGQQRCAGRALDAVAAHSRGRHQEADLFAVAPGRHVDADEPALVVERRAAAHAASAPPGPASPAAESALSGTGQRIYERTRPRLLQVRTLLKTQDSQSSVGSGFLVDESGLLVTNYHVISQFALQPSRHRLVYATVDGRQGALELLAFDVVHDLALLRPADPAPLAGRGAVPLRPADEPLPRGARIFSLGNPLDVGFAVAEGSYNGPVERSFLETLFFGGSLSGGMSGGPALDDQGRLIGVNVAAPAALMDSTSHKPVAEASVTQPARHACGRNRRPRRSREAATPVRCMDAS